MIYDATYFFCGQYLDRRSRTVDQMVQATRSGQQKIAEGSRCAATSSQTELRLLNVARASLEELLLDYEDYLRPRKLRLWDAVGREARQVWGVAVGRMGGQRADLLDLTDAERCELYAPWLEAEDAAVRANAVICLIHQANYLLDR